MFLTIAFLAAGRGTRYSDTGEYDMPKIMVPIKGEETLPMIAASYKNLVEVLEKDEVYEIDALIAITKEMDEAYPELRASVNGAASKVHPRYHLQKGYVKGPALTAEQLFDQIPADEAVLFSNVDQLVKGKMMQQIRQADNEGYDGVIFCFESNESRYSYVIDNEGLAEEMIEKQVVSSKASSGHIFYKKSENFYKSLDELKKSKDPSEEVFISEVCNHSIKSGLKFKVCMLDTFVDLGTPKDLEDLDKKWASLK